MPAWTTQNEYTLLLTIIKLLNVSQLLKWDEVSNEMQALGLEFTAEGCRQHFQKIKKHKSPSTPRKNGISKSSPAKSSPAKRKHAQAVDQDDEEIIMTPSKRKQSARESTNPFETSSKLSIKREVKTEEDGRRQTAHIFKSEKSDGKNVINLDSDGESLYAGE